MLRGFLSALKKSWNRPVGIIIVPYGPLQPWRVKFSPSFILFMVVLWTTLTVWAGYIAGRHFDYYVTKADNKVLQTRMAFVADEISRGRKYLEMTRQTEQQMRQILGMGSKNAIIKAPALGGASKEETVNFRNVLAKKASEISENMFHGGIEQVREESKRVLASFQEISWYIANQRNIYRATPAIWPASGRLTSSFGYRISPFGGGWDYHSGVDISNQPDTPICVTADGVVRHVGYVPGYGQAILIDHGFGYSTLYGHTAEIQVHEGERVARGQKIAKMGTTGRSTGTHVHYEVWQSGKPVNPMQFLKVGNVAKKKAIDVIFDETNGG